MVEIVVVVAVGVLTVAVLLVAASDYETQVVTEVGS